MPNFKKITAIALSFTLSVVCTYSVFSAKSINDLKDEMNKRSESIKNAEKQINNKTEEMNDEIADRNKLDLQISAVLDDINDVESIISEKETQINAKNAEIQELIEKTEASKKLLNARMKVMYEYGASSYLELLLDADGISDLITRISVLKKIFKYDNDIIDSYTASKEAIEQAKSILETEKAEQEEAKSILDNKKSELDTLKSQKDSIINALNNDIEALKKAEQQAENDYNALKNELDAALAAEAKKAQSNNNTTSAPKSTGVLGWPSAASSRITSSYGYRIHPITGTKKLHRGIDIGAGLGTNVLAADSGTVLTAGWNNSYGYYITINHGNGLVTLYAHNSKLLVSKGDTVAKGQIISKCGSTCNSTGPHIHFEVIKNGVLQNPMDYLN